MLSSQRCTRPRLLLTRFSLQQRRNCSHGRRKGPALAPRSRSEQARAVMNKVGGGSDDPQQPASPTSDTLRSLDSLLGLPEEQAAVPSSAASQTPKPLPKAPKGEDLSRMVGAEAWQQQEKLQSRREFLAGCVFGVVMFGSVFRHWLRQPGNRELWKQRLQRAKRRLLRRPSLW